MLLRIFIKTLFILFLSLSANAQMQLMHFDTEKGLPNNLSEIILRDSYGFLWVGTYGGLSKYDGSKFQNYPISDSTNGLSGSTIFSLFEDSKKRLWIGTNKELKWYDRKNDCFISIVSEICVWDIDEGDDGTLWISTFSGILKVDPSTKREVKRFDVKTGIPSNSIAQCIIDTKGILWVATQNEGLFTLNPKTNTIYRIGHNKKEQNTPSSKRIKTIAFYNNNLWIGTIDAGLYVLDTTKKDFKHILSSGNKRMSTIFVDSKKTLWLCQDAILQRFDQKTNTFIPYPAEKYNDRYFKANNIAFITEDSDGNFWFGTFGTGVYCLNKQQNNFKVFYSIPEKVNCLKSNVVNAFVEYNKKIIIASEGGLQYYNPQLNTFTELENKTFTNKGVWNISKYKDDLWCSMWGDGLYRLNVKTNQLTHFLHEDDNSQSLSLNNIRNTALIDNKVWIATWGEGIQAIDESNKTIYSHEFLTKNSKLFTRPGWVSEILKDSKQRIWVATMYGVYLNETGSFKMFLTQTNNPHSLSDNIAYSIFEDSKHQIWVLTSRGLDKYIEKTGTFEHFGKEKNLPQNPMAMLEDSKQNLWISSLNGLYSFNESTGNVRKYDYRNGLLKGEFMPNSALKASDGTLYFGGNHGFISFKPEEFKPTFDVPKIVCRNLSLDNVIQNTIESSDSVFIHYSEAVVSIDVVDLKDIVSNFASFEYSFDNKIWKTIDETKKITFSNKNPGRYFLHIRASYDNKKYSQKRLALFIIPPWWMTWWFRILCLSIVLFLLYTFYKIRLQLIQSQNELLTKLVKEKTSDLVDANEELHLQNTAIAEKEMLLQIRHDELQKTNVTKDKLFSIISQDLKTHFAGIMENAMSLHRSKMLKNEKEKQIYIDSIYNSSKKVNAQLDLFLHWSKSQTKTLQCNPVEIDIESLIRENVSLFYSKAMTKQLDLQCTFEHKFDAFADTEMITIVLRNLIDNAIKFTSKQGQINIKTSNTADYTVIQVIDNGIGMSQEEINTIYTKSINESKPGTDQEQGTGLGLVICRDFLNLNKAKIELSSKIGEGTIVSIFLPKGNILQKNSQSDDVIIDVSTEEILQRVDDDSESKLRLLIVEDNDEIMQYIVGIFEPYYIIETAVNGEEGFAKALKSIPDLVITDINMPVKTGLEMCLQLQSDPILHHVPVIILTAYNNLDMQAKGLQAGAFDYVVKPFDSTILFLKVQTVLESRTKFKDYLKKQFIQQPSSVLNETPDDKFMLMLHNVLEKYYADAEFSVEKFSVEMGYSRSQFFRKLKAIIDTTPLEYLKVFRLNKAKEMLETGKWSVSNVAYDVGFNDPHYFSICFKSHFGFPPNHFTKK